MRLLLLLCLTCASSAFASEQAEPTQPPRPRIGLALGGGSARGLAHIGVLSWFEAHHIPIDVLAGTSMGGLVGGAYASGMSPAEIRALLQQADWDLMFLADSPYKYKTFRRKQDKHRFPSQLEFGLKGGLTLPGALNSGQQVALLLDRIALPYYNLESFDDLPTPFRCVATDLRKGEAVVIDKPPLARAMRATMAIPGVFTPVNWDDWLLVDGGALNNIPADVVRAMGADIVIAVDVGDTEGGGQQVEANTLFSALGRTIDTMMTTNSRRSLASADIVIRPDLTGFHSGSWRQSAELADRGFAAAEKQANQLRSYELSPSAHAAFQAAREARRQRDVPQPSYVSVHGLGAPLPPAMVTKIEHDLAPALNAGLDPDEMAPRLLAIAGTDRYEYLTYGLTDRPKPHGLLIGVRQKSYGPPFLMLGLELNNVDSTNFAFNLSTRVLQYGLLGTRSETRFDVVLGTEQRVAVELVRPLFGSPVFVAPRAYFDRRGRNLYVDDIFAAEYRIKRTGAGVDMGMDFGRWAELRAGFDTAAVRGRRHIGLPGLPEADGNEQYATLSFAMDTQTSPVVPTRGARLHSSLQHYFSAAQPSEPGFESLNHDDEYTTGSVKGSWFHTVRAEDRIFVLGEAGTSFGGEPLIATYSLGGLLELGALNNGEQRGSNVLLGVGGYLRHIGRLPDVLGGGMFAGGWLESGSAFDDWDSRSWKTNVTLGVVVESLLGPAFAGASLPIDGGGLRIYVSLGPLFP